MHAEAPMLCTPPPIEPHASCSLCLLPGPPQLGPWVCQDCQDCLADGEAWWRLHQACDWSELQALCRETGEKFPLLVARAACKLLAGEEDAAGVAGRPVEQARSGEEGAQADPGLGMQPSERLLRRASVQDTQFLCFPRLSLPYPEPWRAQHAALQRGLCGAPGVDAEAAGKLDLDWYVSLLSKIHLNAFRSAFSGRAVGTWQGRC